MMFATADEVQADPIGQHALLDHVAQHLRVVDVAISNS